jgi:hypothetical protein
MSTAIQGTPTPIQQPGLNGIDLKKPGATGSGIVGGSQEVPGADQGTYAANVGGLTLTISLPSMKKSDFEVLLLEALTKMRDMQAKSENETVSMNAEQKKTAIAEKQAALNEAQEKIDKAEEERKNASIWDKIKLAFQALGALISIAVGAVLVATGIGTAAGILLIAAGVVGLVMVVDAALQMAKGFGIAGMIAKDRGATDEEASKADMAFRGVMAGIQIILSIAAMIAMPNPAQLAQSFTTLQALAMQGMNGVQAGISIASAAGDIGAGVVRYQAAQTQAEGLEKKAESKSLEALIKGIDDMIDQAIQSMIAALDRFNTALDELSETLVERNATFVKMQFKA